MTIDMFKCIVKISDYFKQLRMQPLFAFFGFSLSKFLFYKEKFVGLLFACFDYCLIIVDR